MGERINAQARAKLFRDLLENTSIGDVIRCTGLDDDELCSNLKVRDTSDCQFCGAIHIVQVSSIEKRLEHSIDLQSRGIIRKVVNLV